MSSLFALLLAACSGPKLPEEAIPLQDYLDGQIVAVPPTDVAGGEQSAFDVFGAEEDDHNNKIFSRGVLTAYQQGWTPERLEELKASFENAGLSHVGYSLFGSDTGEAATLRIPNFVFEGGHSLVVLNLSHPTEEFADDRYVEFLARHEQVHDTFSVYLPQMRNPESLVQTLYQYVALQRQGNQNWRMGKGDMAAFETIYFPESGPNALMGAYEVEEIMVNGFLCQRRPELMKDYVCSKRVPRAKEALQAYQKGRIELNSLTYGVASTCVELKLLGDYKTAGELRALYIQTMQERGARRGGDDTYVAAYAAQIIDYTQGVMNQVADILTYDQNFVRVYEENVR